MIDAAGRVYDALGWRNRISAVAGPRGHRYDPVETWAAVDRILPGPGKGREY